MEKVKGRIHSIESFGAVDGPGIRHVIFFQGCRLKCLYCHNPDTWGVEGGKEMTAEEILRDIRSYKSYIKSGGVTLSGGEPLLQPEFAIALLEGCRKMGVHTAVDTAGSVNLNYAKPVIDAADMLLLDMKAYDHDLCQEISGKEYTYYYSQNILRYCEEIGKPVWIRHVVVPDYTLSMKKLENLAQYLSRFQCIKKVELLPFHKMGEYKWEELNREYKLYHTREPEKEEMEEVKALFRQYNLPI